MAYDPVVLAGGGCRADFTEDSLLKKWRPEYYNLRIMNDDRRIGNSHKVSPQPRSPECCMLTRLAARDLTGANGIDMEKVQVSLRASSTPVNQLPRTSSSPPRRSAPSAGCFSTTQARGSWTSLRSATGLRARCGRTARCVPLPFLPALKIHLANAHPSTRFA